MQRLEVTLADVPEEQLGSASVLSPVLRGEGPWGHGLPPWVRQRRRCFGCFRKIPRHCEYVFKLTVNGSYSVWLFERVLRGEGPWSYGLPPCMRQRRCRRCFGCFGCFGCFREIPDRCEDVFKHSKRVMCRLLIAFKLNSKKAIFYLAIPTRFLTAGMFKLTVNVFKLTVNAFQLTVNRSCAVWLLEPESQLR